MLIETRDLGVRYVSRQGAAHAVRGVNLGVDRADAIGIVGESGSGKSTAALAMMGLLHRDAGCRVSGEVVFDGQSLGALSPSSLRRIWGNRISMIFQDPQSALNPVMTIEAQVAELIARHRRHDRARSRSIVLHQFREVGLPDPEAILGRFPHQLSGGQLQRVMIAMALVCEPEVIIADEPTTALDLTIQSQILSILTRLCADRGVALILITHDLAVVAETTRRVAVMYAGALVETGRTEDVLLRPRHPYTRALIAAMPKLGETPKRLSAIAGSPMAPTVDSPGCRYAPRCLWAEGPCATAKPVLAPVAGDDGTDHAVACHYADGMRP